MNFFLSNVYLLQSRVIRHNSVIQRKIRQYQLYSDCSYSYDIYKLINEYNVYNPNTHKNDIEYDPNIHNT